MAAATERIPILVTKADKRKFAKKAKVHGLSISEFAREAMEHFNPSRAQEDAELEAFLKQVKAGTRDAELALDHALAYCAESNARLATLDAWMRQHGPT